MSSGLIFSIQRFCLHDGPGIRTVVFFKGCQLSCLWCSNPESKEPVPEIMYNKEICLGCGQCIGVCSQNAIIMHNSDISINRSRCTLCGECVKHCASNALSMIGEQYSIKELLNHLLTDKSYYNISGGGITFSGGEPLYQAEFLIKLANELKKECINLTLETAGYCAPSIFSKTINNIDSVLFDLKLINQKKHKEYTGVENNFILKNFEYSARTKPTTVRIPLIPGVNMDEESCEDFLSIIKNNPVTEVNLLPYHTLGYKKNEYLGRGGWKTNTVNSEKYNEFQKIFENRLNIPVILFPFWSELK